MRLLAAIFIFVVSGILSVASAAAQVQEEKKEPEKAPWYSLFAREDRSNQFAKLRRDRLELTRDLNAAEVEVRELRQKNATLDEATKALRIKIESNQYYASPGSEDLRDQLKRKEFERKQQESRFALNLASMKKDFELLKSKSMRTSEEENRFQNLSRDIEQSPDFLKQQLEEMDFEIGSLKEKISRFEGDEVQRKKSFDEETSRSNATLAGYQKSTDDNIKRIATLTGEMAGSYDRVDAIDADIVKLIDVGDRDGWYKIIISLAFAFLVASVIYGFYRVVGQHVQIVETIFSNDSGIQFITLFSIVIAVILFGIIGVLEGKELSALLGGLSGYILGRTAANVPQKQATPAPQAPAAPVANN